MPREALKNWLSTEPYAASTRTTYWGDLRRLEEHYGDLDKAYDIDMLESIRATLEYSPEDKRNNRPNPSKVEIDGDLLTSLATFRAELNVYKKFRQSEKKSTSRKVELRKDALEKLKEKFLREYPGFPSLGFGVARGAYWDVEREYKETVMSRARELVAEPDGSPAARGQALLAILQQPPANFIGWRSFAQMKAAGEQAASEIGTLLGQMLVDPGDVADLVGAYAAKIHPLLKLGTSGSSAAGQTRTLLSTSLALVRPAAAMTVKTSIMQRAARLLLGRPIFREKIVTAAEYRDMLALAETLYGVMRDEWHWAPKDLWDVQGFLWITDEHYHQEVEPDDDEDTMPLENIQPAARPTNLILYGPPGTGKTYATAFEAVRLCDGNAPRERDTLMARYKELRDDKRIGFVTFHQSYDYETFVEGLRPETSDKTEIASPSHSAAGFRLESKPGVFLRICEAARSQGSLGDVALSAKRFWKMGQGAIGTEDDVYEAAIEGDYIALGWGGATDWSNPEFATEDAVKAEVLRLNPEKTPNPSQWSQTHTFRSEMQIGDIVIVSYGNSKFRAVGEVLGDYYFDSSAKNYPHRRTVKWRLILKEPSPLSDIVEGNFAMRTLYPLPSNRVKVRELGQLLSSAGSENGKPPEQFVLVIDEINRANISKVFGELITLIEPDKRLGMPNEITLSLPYSEQDFGVPANLHIIGTMNTADRSIALLDTALRRRFQFREVEPDASHLPEQVEGVPLRRVLEAMNDRIEYLIDRDHRIGHAFFMGAGGDSRVAVDATMRDKVIPLLQEYFFDDWSRLAAVLGEGDGKGGAFLKCRMLPDPTELGGEARPSWRVRQQFSEDAYDRLIRKGEASLP